MMQYADKALCLLARKLADALIGVFFVIDNALADLGGDD